MIFATFHRAATAALLATLTPLACTENPGTTPPTHAHVTAEAHINAGQTASARGDYELAREELVQAQALDPKPSTLELLGQAELHMNRVLDAYKHLHAVVADKATTPASRDVAQSYLSEAYMHTGHVIIAAPPGARVMVDWKDVGHAPLDEAVDVEPGEHVVSAEVQGATVSHAIKVAAGEGPTIDVAWTGDGPTKALHMTGPGIDASAVVPPSKAPTAADQPDRTF